MSRKSYTTKNSDAALQAYQQQLAAYEARLARYESESKAQAAAAEKRQNELAQQLREANLARTSEAKTKAEDYFRQGAAEQEKYVGDAGYNRSLELGQKGAMTAAMANRNLVESNARQLGMSRAQAAAMGANTITDAYGNTFNAQQSQAYASGIDAANAANQKYSNLANLELQAAGELNATDSNATASQLGISSTATSNLLGIGQNTLQGAGQSVQNYAQGYNMASNLDTTKNQIAKAHNDRTLGWISTGLGAIGGSLQAISDKDAKVSEKIDFSKVKYTGRTKRRNDDKKAGGK